MRKVMTQVEQMQQWLKTSKPIIPIIAIDDINHAIPMATALSAGGVKILEVTLRTPVGLQAIERIKKELPDVIVGAGTVRNDRDFIASLDHGADFIVSPGLTPGLIKSYQQTLAQPNREGVFLPGVASASEIMVANDVGLSLLKCFPASAIGGTTLLKAWAGPFPDITFCPTGGISPENYQDYLALNNVICAGGSWLTEKVLLAQENWPEIEHRAKAIV